MICRAEQTSHVNSCRADRFLRIVICSTAALCVNATPLYAVTVAHWDFETDLLAAGTPVNSQVVSHPSATGLFDAAISDLSGNGNDLSAFAQDGGFTAMQFSSNVASVNNTGSTLSVENAPGTCCPVLWNQDDLEVGGTNVGALAQWAIEASVSFKGLGGWQTFVGKDGFNVPGATDQLQAPLYFQKVGGGDTLNRFRINFVDAAGSTHILDSTTVAQVGTWYHVVATSDGSNLRLYVNNNLEGTLDISASANTAMAALDEAGFEGTGTTVPYAWSLARGMYNDGHGDRLNGYLDDVRISDVALMPSEFLNRPPALLPPTLRIDRDTGQITLFNQQSPVQVVGYSITSEAGGLNGAAWQTIAGNFDANTGGEFDADDEWTVLSAPGNKSDFSEFVFDTTPGDGGALGPSFDVPLGVTGAWRKSLFEDVQGTLKLANGSSIALNIEYTGNGGQAFTRSDLNFDGNLTGADWVIFRTNNLADLSAMSLAEAYGLGDLDGDWDNDVNDFRQFKADYELANGAGSFSQMLQAVPEPATLALVIPCAVLLLGRRRPARTSYDVSNRSFHRLYLAAIVLAAGPISASTEAARTHTYTFNSGNANDSTGSAHGTLMGAANVSGLGQLVLPGAGADFATLPAPTIAINTYTDVTFESWLTRTGAGGAWQRLFDFGDTNTETGFGRNYIFYTPNSGPGDNRAVVSDTDPGFDSEDIAAAGPALTPAAEHHVVVRYDSAANGGNGMMDVFVDGVLGGSVPITKPLSSLSNNLAYLGESLYPADANLNGAINEFRIYNHALTDQEIADNNYFGPTPSNLLALTVNKTTGQVTLRNNHTSDLTIDHYRIDSRGGALNATGWNSLDEQNYDSLGAGEGLNWDQAGGSNANALAELFLEGSSTFSPSESVNLGNAFNPNVFGAGNDGDLVFHFKLTSGEELAGPVTYVMSDAVSGDYNQNGTVDAADYVVWRKNLGQNTPLPNTNPADIDGVVTQAEYTYWRSRFGATAGSGSGALVSATKVPEPTTVALLAGGIALGLLTARPRRRVGNSNRNRRAAMRTEAQRCRSSAATLGLFSVALLAAATAHAATTDRFYQFGDDALENPVLNQPPNADFGPFTVDSAGTTTDFQDLSFTGNGPVYVNTNATSRPGSVSGEWGLSFDGVDDTLIRLNGGLGSPAIGDDEASYSGVINYTGISTRLIDGWVRPTNAGAGHRQDIVNDTPQFGIFISADNRWGMVEGTTTVISTTPVAFNQWSHVMHRTFTNDMAALYVDGVAVAATTNNYDMNGAAANIVFGASVDQSTNLFQGQLDSFSILVAGDNTVQGGQNWGPVNLAIDNDYIRQQLDGIPEGDVNLSGAVDPADVSVFVANWRKVQSVNGVQLGDLTSRMQGDLDFDGDIDLDDAFALHEALLSAGSASGLDFSLLASVPEPSGVLLVACGAVATVGLRRRRVNEWAT